jgi:hypothetical protein
VPNQPHATPSGSRFARLRPSPSMLVAGCALLIAGTSVGAAATGLINGSQIKNGTITGAKLRNLTITGTKITNHTITANKLARGVLRTYRFVLTPSQEGFYFSDPADGAYGYVDGTNLTQKGNPISFSNPFTGVYCLVAGGSAPHIATVSPDYYTDTSSQFTMTDVELNVHASNCPPGAFEVDTFHVSTVYSVIANGPVKLATTNNAAALKKR